MPLRGGSQHKGACHVRVVSAHQRAEVDLDEVARREHGVRRPMVRNRGVGACRNDGLERHSIRAVIQHQRLQLASDLALGPPRPKAATFDQVGQRGVGRFTGQPQQRDLTGVLDLPQRLDHARRADQFDIAGFLRERVEAFDGHDVTLESEPSDTAGRGPARQKRPAGPLDHDFGVGNLLGRLGAVAPVSRQHRCVVVRANQQCRVRAGETGQITHVDQARYQNRVKSLRRQPPTKAVSTLGYSHRP